MSSLETKKNAKVDIESFSTELGDPEEVQVVVEAEPFINEPIINNEIIEKDMIHTDNINNNKGIEKTICFAQLQGIIYLSIISHY